MRQGNETKVRNVSEREVRQVEREAGNVGQNPERRCTSAEVRETIRMQHVGARGGPYRESVRREGRQELTYESEGSLGLSS